MGMRILIVGCGYVGLPLGAELVRHGHVVFGLRRNRAAVGELTAAGISPLFADVTSLDSLKKLPGGIDWVVNCAASAGGDAEDYRRLYLEGNRNLISWLTEGGAVKKFIYTSSSSVYAQNDGLWVNESSPVEPNSPTAKVLVEAEQLLLRAALHHFPAVVLRLAGIYGPGRGYAFKQFLSGAARIEGDGSRHMNMIHRDDVVGAIIAALERGKPGEIYNAVDNEPVTQLAFYGWLAEQLRRPLPPVIVAGGDEHRETRKRGVTNKRVSNEKLRTELGYRFKHPDFRAGYAEMAQGVEGTGRQR
jgi:nucleoside-diphosphate-sugar epimerase